VEFSPETNPVVIDPANPDSAIYSNGNRLFKTMNAGASSSPFADLPVNTNIISLSPSQTSMLYVAGQGVFISKDGGQTWVEHSNGLGAASFDLKLDPLNTDKLFAENGDCNLFQSLDGGKSWTRLNYLGCNLTIDPGSKMYYVNNDTGLFTSSDGGINWSQSNISFPAGMPNQQRFFSFDPFKSRFFLIINHEDGSEEMHYSDDQGGTWLLVEGVQNVNNGLLFFTGQDPEAVYMIGDGGPSRSSDGGKTWSQCSQEGFTFAHLKSRLVIDPRDSNSVYLATQPVGVLASHDGCLSWQPKNAGLGNLSVNSIATDPNHPDTMYVGTDNGAFVSSDSGEHWGEISDGLLGETVVYSIVVDNQSNVYAGTPYGIFKLGGK
jgi:photosystem II stability/assembly factor-like uncharacterized protein